MHRHRLPILISLAVAAVISWLSALPARALSFVHDLALMAFPRPTLVLDGQPVALAISPRGHQISAPLWHRNRHEAGLARLGAVRHT